MNIIDKQYKDLLRLILDTGEDRPDRTGTGVLSVFSPPDLRFNISTHFPVITCRQVPYKSILHESIWMFCQGSTNIKYLQDNNVKIWNEWAVNNGELGPIYGSNFRAFQGHRFLVPEYVDQLTQVIETLKTNKYSRRHLISGWNPSTAPIELKSFQENYELGRSVLPQCHGVVIQFYVSKNDELSMKYYIRSSDTVLGLPANCQNAAFLLRVVSQCTGYTPKDVIISFGDAHIYKDHIEGVQRILDANIESSSPKLVLNTKTTNINDFKFEDFELIDYLPQEKIKFQVSV